ncbi:uncharacterized protein [Nicotiana sylvestris]|uniref:uncharacterized protein n=1 Tax=Nicotiana sylvestris TaxID=4096 RepID=UPI00388C6BA7
MGRRSGTTAILWLPNEIPDLALWSRKLAACLTYNKHRWRDLSKGRWEAKHHGRRLAACFLRKAFDKLKSELLRHEARMRKASDREGSLRLLCERKEGELVYLRCKVDRSWNCESRLERQLERKIEELEHLWGKVGQAKCELNELKARVDAQVAAKEDALTKASALEVQIHNAHANDSIRVNIITRLESELLKVKVKVVNPQAEAVISRTRADQKVPTYLKGAAYARAELRESLDHDNNSKEYVKCKSRRETLEKIHARGFDLSEEIEQAKAEEHDATFLLSDAEDREDEADEP